MLIACVFMANGYIMLCFTIYDYIFKWLSCRYSLNMISVFFKDLVDYPLLVSSLSSHRHHYLLFMVVLGIGFGTLHIQGRHFSIELPLQTSLCLLVIVIRPFILNAIIGAGCLWIHHLTISYLSYILFPYLSLFQIIS